MVNIGGLSKKARNEYCSVCSAKFYSSDCKILVERAEKEYVFVHDYCEKDWELLESMKERKNEIRCREVA